MLFCFSGSHVWLDCNIVVAFCAAIPPNPENDGRYEECEYYLLDYDNMTDAEIWSWDWSAGSQYRNSTDTAECDSWVYDMSEFTNTAVTEVNTALS